MNLIPSLARSLTFSFLFIGMLTGSLANAGEAVFYVIEAGKPLPDITVSLNDETVAAGKDGIASSNVSAGTYQGKFLRSGSVLGSFQFAVNNDNENVEVKAEIVEGEISISAQTYTQGAEENAPLGKVSGVITSSDTGAPVVGATVSVVGTDIQTTTDEAGAYSLQLPRGKYDLSINHADFGTRELSGVRVISSLASNMNMAMSATQSKVVEEVVIVGKYMADSAFTDERDANALVEAIDTEQFKRFGDSSAVAALSRVTGVSVVGGQFAVVRGMSGRYISTTLNGGLLPSTDPLRRDVPLDLFPSSVLGGIQIRKSYTPDMPADSAGGSIAMETKGLPSEHVHQLSISSAYNFAITGEDILTYTGGDQDYLGYDDGTRELPGKVDDATDFGSQSFKDLCNPPLVTQNCLSSAQLADYGKSFENIYDVRTRKAQPDFGISYAYGDMLDNGFGYYAAIQYKHAWDARIDASTYARAKDLVANDGRLQLLNTGSYDRSTRKIDLTGYFVAGLEYGEENQVLSKTILLRKTEDVTKFSSNLDLDNNKEFNTYLLEWVERELISQQFLGTQVWQDGTHRLDWRVGVARSSRYEPDRRTYRYENGQFIVTSLERRYSDLTEDSNDLGLDYTFEKALNDEITMRLKAGLAIKRKDREFELGRFGVRSLSSGANGGISGGSYDLTDSLENLLAPSTFDAGDVRFTTSGLNTDSYDATEDTDAYYLSSEFDYLDSLTLIAGFRVEDFTQELEYPNAPAANPDPLDESNTLPVVGLTWRATDEFQLRFSYSELLSRPGLIERNQSSQYDPETDELIAGNPNLTISKIQNYDVRAEYYFSDTESVSLALFSKNIDDPIEKTVIDASGSASDGYTFRQAKKADLKGFELEVRREFYPSDTWSGFFAGNYTYIDSEVTLSGRSVELEGRTTRELQGQSEFLYNLQLGLDHIPTGQSFTLLANYFDDRIFRVANRAAGDKIEDGRIEVDFVYNYDINEAITVKAKVQNIFDAPVRYEQLGHTIETYSKGAELSFGVEIQL